MRVSLDAAVSSCNGVRALSLSQLAKDRTMTKTASLTENLLAPSVLPLVDALKDMGREMMENAGETDEDPIAYYGEWYMESLSEAGYSEARPHNRRSARAFYRVLRVKQDDLQVLKNAIGYRRGEYHDYAVADSVIDALSRFADVAAALPLIAPAEGAEPAGPYFPARHEFDVSVGALAAAVDWAGDRFPGLSDEQLLEKFLSFVVVEHLEADDLDAPVKKLAGLFKLEAASATSIAAKLRATGATSARAETVFAYVTLAAVRATPRFVAGTRWAKPKNS